MDTSRTMRSVMKKHLKISTDSNQGEVQKVDLFEHGYELSAANQGDPTQMEVYLEKIKAGILTSNEKRIEPEVVQVPAPNKELGTLKSNLIESQENLKELEEFLIPEKEMVINYHEQKVVASEEKIAGTSSSNFGRIVQLVIKGLGLAAISAYATLFFISLAHRALSNNFTIGRDVPFMPSQESLYDALSFNFSLLIVPVIMLLFGLLIHLILTTRINKKTEVGIVLGIVAALNVLLAVLTQLGLQQINESLGLEAGNLFASPNFYIQIGASMLVFLIWAYLLHINIQAWKKAKDYSASQKTISKHEVAIKKVQKEIFELKFNKNNLKSRIKNIEHKIENFTDIKATPEQGKTNHLFKDIEAFAKGWLSFLQLDKHTALRNECSAILNSFKLTINREI